MWPQTAKDISAQATKVHKMTLLRTILAPGHQSPQNDTSEADSGHIQAQAAKVHKITLLRTILAISRPRPPKTTK